MATISAASFVGTRTRFQRLRDAKIFSGWIESCDGDLITLSTNTQAAIQIGDVFRIEGYGHKVSMIVNAQILRVGQLDLMSDGIVAGISGTKSSVIEAKRVTFQMRMSGPSRFSSSNENVRIKTPLLPVMVKSSQGEIQGFSLDVSMQGIGFTTAAVLVADEDIEAAIQTKYGMLSFRGNVRYCTSDRDRDGMYRCGIHLDPLDRTVSPKWEMLVENPA
ncbi:hypothetical protein CCB80_01580 [Armatimonadetes bacterium Uphvl-Ar1]|nr:hypothetical protein CCB80_01580 [Armatimonadetes bacterium Uphvl-Ar1]